MKKNCSEKRNQNTELLFGGVAGVQERVDLVKGVNYTSGKTPPDYKCGKCSVTNCKLWREYQTFDPSLLCAACAAEIGKKDISDIDKDGRHTHATTGTKTDTIGWFVPAIPDEEGVGYWGYSSVPPIAINWWRNLPTIPASAYMLGSNEDGR